MYARIGFLVLGTAQRNRRDFREGKCGRKEVRCGGKKRGGLAVKFVSPGFNGVPDRLVLFPGGRMAFVELKALGETMRPLQQYRARQLAALGFRVYTVDCKERIGGILDEIQTT